MNSEKNPGINNEHPTIFHEILHSGLPASELTPLRLQGEAQTVVAAGTLTTAHYLKVMMYNLLANPKVLGRLNKELQSAIPNAAVIPPYLELDRLPYFSAVINEGFRLTHGVFQRLTRIAPNEDLHVAGYTIKAGTPISMSSWLNHLDPEIFPSPDEFRPERWLEPGADRKKKYLANFSKGSRVCLGKDLAKAEIVYTLSMMVRRWVGVEGNGIELFETTQRDVEVEHDFFSPFSSDESLGVRVLLK